MNQNRVQSGDPRAGGGGRARLHLRARTDLPRAVLRPPRAGVRAHRADSARASVLPAGPEDVVIRIMPGASFGAGRHPTTRLALRGIEFALARCGEPLIGPAAACSTSAPAAGVLAMAAVLLGIEGGVWPSTSTPARWPRPGPTSDLNELERAHCGFRPRRSKRIGGVFRTGRQPTCALPTLAAPGTLHRGLDRAAGRAGDIGDSPGRVRRACCPLMRSALSTSNVVMMKRSDWAGCDRWYEGQVLEKNGGHPSGCPPFLLRNESALLRMAVVAGHRGLLLGLELLVVVLVAGLMQLSW
ncbi:MAG: 50S ribosomal protein L11 methyltransferase [Desulfobacterales bacterium]|nr:50S ribosomal protein L11 methyltransferase [Desulfobacterales bacterium]